MNELTDNKHRHLPKRGERPPPNIMCHPMKERKATDNAAKGIEHESDQASGPSRQRAGSTEDGGELHGEDKVKKNRGCGKLQVRWKSFSKSRVRKRGGKGRKK